jgi:predicted PurR-regulated permease PerM
MFRILEGAGILLLLSVFFAYLLAPALPPVRRRVRFGRRNRPISDASAILLLYIVLFVPCVLIGRASAPAVTHWINVTAPAGVDRLFAGGRIAPLEAALAGAGVPAGARDRTIRAASWMAASLEHSTRATLAELIAAAHDAGWLLVTPIVAFILLSGAPAFQRSALRVLPRGHLQWRFEEFLRDVNSALAGYVRAQAAAAVIVGAACVVGFVLIGAPSAISLGVLAGILELVPAIGPLTALLIATSQGERVVAIVVFLATLRIVQDYVVYPRLVRRGMHLSTLAVILTVWTGAVVANAPGVILAIPVAGFLSVSMRHWREYREIERLVVAAAHQPPAAAAAPAVPAIAEITETETAVR